VNTKSYHTLSATSLGLTLLLVAALVAIGLGTAPGQMATARLTLGALACLSGGSWLVLRQREEDLAAGRAFSWAKTTAKIGGWLLVALAIAFAVMWGLH
jgi:hypothetical protein